MDKFKTKLCTAFRKLIIRLEKRIRFAKYSIEKCYLYHRIASVHLSQLHYDECCLNARRAIKGEKIIMIKIIFV